MGVTVRTDRRTSMLYLDIHTRAKRKRVFTGLPDTSKNRTVLQTKAEQIEREIFLGIFDASKHFSQEARKQRLTFRQLAAEWCKKKQNEVAPLTFEWYVEVIERSILPFWGAKRVEDVSPAIVDAFKATLLGRKLAPRTINIILSRLKDMLRMAYERGHIAKDVSRWALSSVSGGQTSSPYRLMKQSGS